MEPLLKVTSRLQRARCGRENDEDVTLWHFDHPGASSLQVRIDPVLVSNDGDVVRNRAISGEDIIVRSEWSVADDLRTAVSRVRSPPTRCPTPRWSHSSGLARDAARARRPLCAHCRRHSRLSRGARLRPTTARIEGGHPRYGRRVSHGEVTTGGSSRRNHEGFTHCPSTHSKSSIALPVVVVTCVPACNCRRYREYTTATVPRM